MCPWFRGASVYLKEKYGAGPSVQTLNRWRSDVTKGKPNPGPKFRRMGVKTVIYLVADLDDWALRGVDQTYPQPERRRRAARGR